MPLILRPVVLQQVLPHQRRPVQHRKMHVRGSRCVTEARIPIRRFAAVDGIEELLDFGFGPDALLDFAAREMELVSPVRHACFHDGFEGGVCRSGSPIGRADGEEVGDEVGVPERGSVGDGSALFSLMVNPKKLPCLERR